MGAPPRLRLDRAGRQRYSGHAGGQGRNPRGCYRPAQALEHSAGHLLAAAVLSALRRQQHGGVWHAEVSLARLAHWLLEAPSVAQETEPNLAPPSDVPLLRLSTSHGEIEVVPPVHSPPWRAGLQEFAAWDRPWPTGAPRGE